MGPHRQQREHRRQKKQDKVRRRQKQVRNFIQRLGGGAPPSDRLPVHGCWVDLGWRDSDDRGLAVVFLARKAGAGTVHLAGFLIDHWGFGLKDCFLHRAIPEEAVPHILQQAQQDGIDAQPAELTLAQQLIWGGVEYAVRNGFRLPREFVECKAMVGALPEGVEIPWNLFGRDGKPFIMATLEDIVRRSARPFDVDRELAREDRHYAILVSPSEDPTLFTGPDEL